MQRILILLVVSAVIFEARPGSLVPLLLAAAAALLVSVRLPHRETALLNPLRMLRFLPWFLSQSVLGGLDVALRAFRGRRALNPGLVEYTTRLQRPIVRVIFANTVSLMPGTLTAQLHGDHLTVHALDHCADIVTRLAEVEHHVGRAFGEDPA
ncbi:MAG TPA: Na+/H+ antiporter subunit E [Longimicrobiales bacterium]|nr:Na+/H+ antiporter subunit E [Longimicrobiales bacterium]